MFKYRVEGEAKPKVYWTGIDDYIKEFTEDELLEHFNNVDGDDNFVEYAEDQGFYEKLVGSAYMKFKVKDGKLFTQVDYDFKEELSMEEKGSLIEYTQGQWSDGIGEGFEQQYFKEEKYDNTYKEYYISPWFYGQVATCSVLREGI